MKFKTRQSLRYALLAVVIATMGSIAIADDNDVWQTKQELRAYDNFYDDDGKYVVISLWLIDYAHNFNYAYSGILRSYAYKRSTSYPLVYEWLYECEQYYLIADAFNVLPDNSSLIGSNTPLSYSYVAPACNGYPETTFSIYCDAGETTHSVITEESKSTYGDGTKKFWVYERERVASQIHYGVNDHTCTFSISNALGSASTEFALANAEDARLKEK